MTTITLQAKSIGYFSHNDETAFFGWLKAIECVVSIKGTGRILYIEVDSEKFSDEFLRELLALLWRHHVEMRQLAQFASDENRHWFADPIKYWHSKIFDDDAPTQRTVSCQLGECY